MPFSISYILSYDIYIYIDVWYMIYIHITDICWHHFFSLSTSFVRMMLWGRWLLQYGTALSKMQTVPKGLKSKLTFASKLLSSNNAQCAVFYSTIALFPKTEIPKPLSHGKKIIFDVFLCSFRMKTFIFRHQKHYFLNNQNRSK